MIFWFHCASSVFRYEDFFGPKRKVSKKSKLTDGLEDSDRSDEQEDDQATDNKVALLLSSHTLYLTNSCLLYIAMKVFFL